MTNTIKDDEIDVSELIETIWSGKWVIVASMAIAMIMAGAFLMSTPAQYKSKLRVQEVLVPPYSKAGVATQDFQRLFFSEANFNEWKDETSNLSLSFEDISTTEEVNGIRLSKPADELFVEVKVKKTTIRDFVISTDDIGILAEIYRYMRFINDKTTETLMSSNEKHLARLELNLESSWQVSGNVYIELLSFYDFVNKVKNGANIFHLQDPTVPAKTSPKTTLTLVMSILLGGFAGVVFVLLSKAIRTRKMAAE